jgi:hypothetical protein
MDIRNTAIEYNVEFLTNKGDFNEQPIFVIAKDSAISGIDWVSLVRQRDSNIDGASGRLVLYVSTSAGLYSATGTYPIYARASATSSLDSLTYNTTANSKNYRITTVFNKGERADVIVNDNGVNYLGVSLSGIRGLYGSFKNIGTGIRSTVETIPPDGTTGKSLVLYYTFNKNELGSSLTSVVDRSGNGLTASLKGTLSGDGTTSSVTAWSYSPFEGGMRFNGSNSFIESATSSLLFPSNSAMTLMTYFKASQTGNRQFICNSGSGNTFAWHLSIMDAADKIRFGHPIIDLPIQVQPGKWYNIVVSVNNTTSNLSGTKIYINGMSVTSGTSVGFKDICTDGRLVIGASMATPSTSSLTGSIGLLKIWNRALSANEVLYNYLATAPAYMSLDSIKIG